MRVIVFAFLTLSACAPQDRSGDNDNALVMENNSDNMIVNSPAGECVCQYSPPEDVTLKFIKKQLSDEVYEVDFVVKEQSGVEFEYGARISKICTEDFEKKGTISATLERKKSGTCDPIYIQPKDYPEECWN